MLGIAAYMTFSGPSPPPPDPVLTADAKEYLPNLGLENVHMQAAESYSNQRVIEILGDINNNKGNPRCEAGAGDLRVLRPEQSDHRQGK